MARPRFSMIRWVAVSASVLVGLALLGDWGAGPARTMGAETGAPTFQKDVLPILQASCFQCHGADKPGNNLDLRTLAGLLKGGKTGPAVVPGSLRESLLWTNLATDKMPRTGAKATDPQKETIRRWLLAGAPDDSRNRVALVVPGKNPPATKPPTNTAPAVTSGPPGQRGVEAMARLIDAEIDAKLKAAGIAGSPPADDAEFCRRVHLDLTGKIPTIEATLAFLDSSDPDKRRKLIDALLQSPEYGRHFAVIWHKLLLPRTAEEYGRIDHDKFKGWLADGFNSGRGWNKTVTDMLTATGYVPARDGKTPKGADAKDVKPEVSYIAIHHEDGRPQPRAIAASSSRLFLGLQIDCAQCHNHPLAKWKQSEFWGVAAFFERVRYPNITGGLGNVIEPATGKAQVYNQKGRYWFVPAVRPEPAIDIQDQSNKETGKLARARFLGGPEPKMSATESYRAIYARWMTAPENPFFARAMVNRIWSHTFGRGIVEPIDDMQDDNPPSHPRLLDELTREFAASGFDLKHLLRGICSSQAYQRASRPSQGNGADRTHFARQHLKLMTAEQLLDSLCIAVPPLEAKRAEPPDAKGRVAFSTGDFLNVLESDESSPTEYSRGLLQALRLMNREGKLANREALGRVVQDGAAPEKNVERIYLLVLSRRPTAQELKEMTAFVKNPASIGAAKLGAGGPAKGPVKPPDAYVDLYWALLNSSEFIFNH